MSKSTISSSTLRRLALQCSDPDTTDELDDILERKKRGGHSNRPSVRRMRSVARRCTDPDTVEELDRRLYRHH